MVEIMVAHNIPYTATACTSYPEDFIKKLQKAKEIKGPKYIQILAPCPTGWRMAPNLTVEIGKLAVMTCAYPLYEVEYGRYKISRKPAKKKPVIDYLKLQGRFRHLPSEELEQIQRDIDKQWEMLLKKEEVTNE